MSGAFGVSRPGGVRTTLHGHIRWAGHGGRAASRVQASPGARSPRRSGGGAPRCSRPRPGMVRWTHRIASIPLARVCLAFVTGRGVLAHASAHASTWALRDSPPLSSGAVSCSRQGNVDIVAGAASYSRQNNVAIVPGAVSSSPPGPGRRSTAGGRGETADAIPACPAPACERAPLEAVMRAPPREARSVHHAVRGGARPAASLPGPSPELTAARPESRPRCPAMTAAIGPGLPCRQRSRGADESLIVVKHRSPRPGPLDMGAATA